VITRANSPPNRDVGWIGVNLSLLTSKGMSTVYSWPPSAGECIFVIDSSGNYIVIERGADDLVKVTPNGTMTEIYKFVGDYAPTDVKIDSAGNYIVTGMSGNKLSKISPDGVMTVIANLTAPNAVAIDRFGNYIVTQTKEPTLYDESTLNRLSRVYPNGTVSVIHDYSGGTLPLWLAIDSSGNYIVTLYEEDKISMVTPAGVERTVASGLGGPYSTVIDADGNYIVSSAAYHQMIRISPDGVRTVLYTFQRPPGTVQVISAGDLRGAPTITASTVTPTTSSVATRSSAGTTSASTGSGATSTSTVATMPVTTPTKPSTTSTATTSGAGSTASSQAQAGGWSPDNTLLAVAAVGAITIAVAALALRRKH